MKRKQKKQISKMSKIILVAALTTYFCVIFIKQEINIVQLRNNTKAIEREIQQATQKKKEIDEQLQTENYHKRVEDIARDKLGFLKNDEILFVDSAEK